jgi:hypothetical protein
MRLDGLSLEFETTVSGPDRAVGPRLDAAAIDLAPVAPGGVRLSHRRPHPRGTARFAWRPAAIG